MTEDTDSLCVCVVESDEAIRMSLARLLRASRIDTQLFSSLSEFNNAPRRSQHSCLLVDLRSLSPREYAMLTQPTAATRSMPPLIAVSDLEDEASQRKARELGARFLLHKPVDGQALLDAIHWITDASEPVVISKG